MVEMRRGDVVVVALPGAYGKARPAVIVQADRYSNEFHSIILCPLTSILTAEPTVRVVVDANQDTGLRDRSSIMVEKIIATPRDKVSAVIGHLDNETMSRLDYALAIILGLR